MRSSFEKHQKRRLTSSYLSVVISMTLVLFLLGFLGFLAVNAKNVSDYFREQVTLTVYLKDTAKGDDVKQLEKTLASARYVKALKYISKAQAAKDLKAENGEAFMDFLGYNPLQNAIDIQLKGGFVSTHSLKDISKSIQSRSFVDSVSYDAILVRLMNRNVKKISFWGVSVGGIFVLISVLLINSSIRLSIYAKRFTIKTMQMVGATKPFIRRPFVWRGFRLGLLAGVIASLGIAVVIGYLSVTFPELQLLEAPDVIALLLASIMALGCGIAWVSTHFATQRFLNLKTDDLYD